MNEAKVGRVQADVWAVIDGVAPLTQSGVAADSILPSAKGLPPTLVDPHRRWIATNLATRSLGLQHAARPQGAGAAQLSGPARPALEEGVRLESERHDWRLGLHRDRAAPHGRGTRH